VPPPVVRQGATVPSVTPLSTVAWLVGDKIQGSNLQTFVSRT